MSELAKHFPVQVIKNEESVYSVRCDGDGLCVLRAPLGQLSQGIKHTVTRQESLPRSKLFSLLC